LPDLTVSHLDKSFPAAGGPRQILHDVSFEVPEGEVLCLLGPNGSGKTTLLKTLCTLLSPERGSVRLGDLDVHRRPDRAKRLIGFSSSEDHSFYGRLTVRMNLWFYAQMHGLGRDALARRLDALGRQLDLDMLDRPFRELSSGQKQRVLLARALLHDPPVLLLDEPHQNLDPHFSVRLRDLLTEEWGGRGRKTVVVSTHHLEDARKISDRWLVIAAGRVRFSGSLSEARERRPDHSLERFFQELTRPTDETPHAPR
jgi:sodium transport system ATP-binding protein